MDFSELGMEAFEIDTGVELLVEPVLLDGKADPYIKFYRIYLDRPVAQNERFAVKWRFRWPNCFPGRLAVDYCNIAPFRQGVGHLVHKLKFTIPIFEEPSVCHVIDGILERSSVDPNYRELHGKHSVSYDVSNPPDGTDAYILVS